MGYCTVDDITKVLAQSLTSATPDTQGNELGDLINVGDTLDTNLITTDKINYYMSESDAFINSAISLLYLTPLKQIADIELPLLADVNNEYSTVLALKNALILNPGDTLFITDGNQQETLTVKSVSEGSFVTLTAGVLGTYSMSDTRVVRVKYPDPIPFVAARRAAAMIYDKYFSAQANTNESKYGNYLRGLANQAMNSILAGATILHGQHRIKNRNLNSNIVSDGYGLWDKIPDGWKLDDPKT